MALCAADGLSCEAINSYCLRLQSSVYRQLFLASAAATDAARCLLLGEHTGTPGSSHFPILSTCTGVRIGNISDGTGSTNPVTWLRTEAIRRCVVNLIVWVTRTVYCVDWQYVLTSFIRWLYSFLVLSNRPTDKSHFALFRPTEYSGFIQALLGGTFPKMLKFPQRKIRCGRNKVII